MNSNKSVAICKIKDDPSTGTSSKTLWTVEEVLSARLNNWEGWLCAAGFENIHISADGNIFSASCRVGGYLGNVFEGQISLPKKWITCTKKWCMCGADMQIRKASSLENSVYAQYELPPDSAAEQNGSLKERMLEASQANMVVPAQYEFHQQFPKSITWDISRRCNYSCSYCHPSVSNQYDSHHSQKTLFAAIDRIHHKFCLNEKTKWVFTGGEPTLNPAFMDVVDKINSLGHLIHVQSNGSRGPDYFQQLISKACIGLSLHLEADSNERFIDTCKAIIDEKQKNIKASQMWFGIRIMVGPGRLQEALTMKKNLLDIPNFAQFAQINLSPLYKRLKQDELMSYPDEEFNELLKHA